jgi:hypothetical protein
MWQCCGKQFDSYYFDKKRNKPAKLIVNYDHFNPFIYSRNNKSHNIIASCNICNSVKSDKCFNSIEEAREWLKNQIKWDRYEFAEEQK